MGLDGEFLELKIIGFGGRVSYKNMVNMNDADKLRKMFQFLQDKYGLTVKGNKGWFE